MKKLFLYTSVLLLTAFWGTLWAATTSPNLGSETANFNTLQQKISEVNQLAQKQIQQLQTNFQNQMQTLNTQLQNKIKQVQAQFQQQLQQLQQQINKLGQAKSSK
jgi:DNA anti-recombination protein RmuC